jgi:hypothetical protein
LNYELIKGKPFVGFAPNLSYWTRFQLV